jgi:hypothetical protein
MKDKDQRDTYHHAFQVFEEGIKAKRLSGF